MNKKKHKVSLLNSLINSNFLILNKNHTKNLKHLRYKSNSYLGETALNLLETLKTVKEFIRILQFLKKKNLLLHLLVDNKQHADLLTSFFETRLLNVLISSFLSKTAKTKNAVPFLVMLSDPLNNNKNMFKNFEEKKIFLVSKINAKVEKNNWGTYKIYNDLHDFKKIVFLLSVLDLVLKKNKINDEI
jgi:hypothetical protein